MPWRRVDDGLGRFSVVRWSRNDKSAAETPADLSSYWLWRRQEAILCKLGSGRRIGPRIRGDRQGRQILRNLVGGRGRGRRGGAAAASRGRHSAATRSRRSRASGLASLRLAALLAKQPVEQGHHRLADRGPRAAANLLTASLAAVGRSAGGLGAARLALRLAAGLLRAASDLLASRSRGACLRGRSARLRGRSAGLRSRGARLRGRTRLRRRAGLRGRARLRSRAGLRGRARLARLLASALHLAAPAARKQIFHACEQVTPLAAGVAGLAARRFRRTRLGGRFTRGRRRTRLARTAAQAPHALQEVHSEPLGCEGHAHQERSKYHLAFH